MYHKNRETGFCCKDKELNVYSSMLAKLAPIAPRPRRIVTRSKKNDRSWDPDDKRRINENKNWRADKPEEEAWDIDKERDAIRYKIEHLEALLGEFEFQGITLSVENRRGRRNYKKDARKNPKVG